MSDNLCVCCGRQIPEGAQVCSECIKKAEESEKRYNAIQNRKVAVYAGTRNLYEQMYVALKSLLANNLMDRVYLLIEDDEYPFPVPDIVYPVNISGQELFPKDGANYINPWSYMTMMRCALATMLPRERKVLWLDCDTIVDQDITDLFSLDMRGLFYAAVNEPKKSIDIFRYVNAGVLLCDLDNLRTVDKETELMELLNNVQLTFPDQEAINLLCQGRIRLLDSEYNASIWTPKCLRPRIFHYAGIKDEDMKRQWAYKKYENIKLFEEVQDE